MAARKTKFEIGELYHIYNRGVDKRDIFLDEAEHWRFLQSMAEFNAVEPIGSIYEKSIADKNKVGLGRRASNGVKKKQSGLVNFIAYCLNRNHYHFILEQKVDNGIEKFMHRLGTGYSKYFNNRHQRSGALFQNRFQSVHVDSNEYLLHLSVYVNLNDRLHPESDFGRTASKRAWSSWNEYCHPVSQNNLSFCERAIILDQFRNQKEYIDFAEETLPDIIERKKLDKELASSLID